MNPYQSVIPDIAYSSPVNRGRWVRILLTTGLTLTVLNIILTVAALNVSSGAASTNEAATVDAEQAVITLIQYLIRLVAFFFFLDWFYRVYSNLSALGCSDREHKAGWAVGGFFVPFLNLVRPFTIMREVWKGSDPSTVEQQRDESGLFKYAGGAGTPSLVIWWWVLWLVSGILFNLTPEGEATGGKRRDLTEFVATVRVVSDLSYILYAIVAYRLIGQVTEWQARRIERVRELDNKAFAAQFTTS